MPDFLVIGVGNPIMKDDGVGLHAVRYLEGRLPENVELLEGSVYCADLLPFLENRRKVVFIDGIDAGSEPGTLFRFSPDEVGKQKGKEPLSLHDFGIYELITAAKLLDQCPEEITLIAVQVKNVEIGEELSQEVREAIPRIYRLLLEELGVTGSDEIPED
jgi:hydrogenase maturation protease